LLELFRREASGRQWVAVVTERDDGDVHPLRVDASTLVRRQRIASGRTWVMLDEHHGTAVHHARRSDRSNGADPIAGVGDVLVGDGDAALAIWAADCAPVVLFGRSGRTVACHAGWRGLAAGVLDVAVGQLAERCVAAVLGPCIHPCCYEFGSVELQRVSEGLGIEQGVIRGRTSAGALALDVPAAVRAGLAEHHIALDVSGPCTRCEERWYSHRRGDADRQAVVSWSEVAQ